MFRKILLTFVVGLAALPMLDGRAMAQDDLAAQGYAVLKQYCYGCHGEKFNGNAAFNVLDREALITSDEGYLAPGKPADSHLWQRIADGEMPPENAKQLSGEEREILKRWIEAGAPLPGITERVFKSQFDVLAQVYEHLRTAQPVDRPFLRYFTLAHLYNNNEHVTEFDLRLYRAALSKAVNMLSFERQVHVPQPIDREQSIYVIDLRDLGWDKNDQWKSVLKEYPYGLEHSTSDDPNTRRIYHDLTQISHTPLPYVRADWFVAVATRPPLYHKMLQLPKTAAELEKRLGVDVAGDFKRNKMARAGFAKSGVSTQNRIVDRHTSAFGMYWRSYDFARNENHANIFQFPLGPAFKGNEFSQNAFEPDGGEMIFSLPNGLHGYFLIDGKGQRIDEGPIEVVRDARETSGTPTIVTGLSCAACHRHGMIGFEDTVRSGTAVFGEARLKVQELFPEQPQMDRLITKDQRNFLAAIEAATSTFLQVEEDRDKEIAEFAEPVGAIARFYLRDVSLEDAAAELGIPEPEKLKTAIETNPTLVRMGLGPLAQGNDIKRKVWHSREFLLSAFQQTARILGLGTPHVVLQAAEDEDTAN